MPPDVPHDRSTGNGDRLTPEQERAVRDRLAAARHEGPVPDEVAARLDATLAHLTAEREAPLTARRRRRRWTTGLVAAAATVLAVVGVGQVMSGPTGSGGSGGQDAVTAQESTPDAAREPDAAGPAAADVGAAVPRVSPDTFRRDVRRARRRTAPAATPLHSPAPEAACAVGTGGPRRVLVHYRAEPAVLVYARPEGGRQRVVLRSCDDGGAIRSTSIAPR